MQRRDGWQTTSTRNLLQEHWITHVGYFCPFKNFSDSLPDDDYAVSILARVLNKSSDEAFFRKRGMDNPFTIFNADSGFMEARNANGSWAGENAGWTEGDKWAYSFDVVQDMDALIKHRGGEKSFVKSLDEHFDGGQWIFSPRSNPSQR